MEWAARHPICPLFLERHIGFDDAHQIGTGTKVIDEILVVEHGKPEAMFPIILAPTAIGDELGHEITGID